jgi:hypothetical protein
MTARAEAIKLIASCALRIGGVNRTMPAPLAVAFASQFHDAFHSATVIAASHRETPNYTDDERSSIVVCGRDCMERTVRADATPSVKPSISAARFIAQ